MAALGTALVGPVAGARRDGAVAGAMLVAATLIVPLIALRIFKLWPGGKLAAKTNAAEA